MAACGAQRSLAPVDALSTCPCLPPHPKFARPSPPAYQRGRAQGIDEQEPETPLFLYLAFTAPHTPYQAPQEYLDKYATVPDDSRRAYAAMIDAMDVQIGRVLDARGPDAPSDACAAQHAGHVFPQYGLTGGFPDQMRPRRERPLPPLWQIKPRPSQRPLSALRVGKPVGQLKTHRFQPTAGSPSAPPEQIGMHGQIG